MFKLKMATGRWLAASLLAGALLPVAAVSPVIPRVQAQTSSRVCFKSSSPGGDGFVIGVLPEFGAIMQSRGFVAIPCPGTDEDYMQYRVKICSDASRLPEAVKKGFEGNYGISLADLCSMAGGIPG